MIQTLIIEDEVPAAARLEKLLLEINPEIQILDKLDSVDAAVSWFSRNEQPDLLILDIQLADGLCFDIFRKIKIDSFVIFTTAYDEYAIKAFELNSIDYLLKPVNKIKLEASLEKYRHLAGHEPQFNFDEIIKAIESKKSGHKKRFAISIGSKIRSIETSEIAYIVSLEKSTFLGTFDGHEYPIDFSLDRLEEMLDPDQFFRINRQNIINYRAIGKINILSKSRLELDVEGSKEPMLVSTARAHEFRMWIDK
jgi:two-component system response regulator LytT